MEAKKSLPRVSKKKKINIKEFVRLARRVRKYFEEEEKYLEKNADRQTPRLFINNRI